MIQYPAMSSLVSVKGPSMTVRLPPENLMRKPLELGWSPARSRSTPAFISSSLYLPIAERSSSLGMMPASESLLAFPIILNLMVNLSLNYYVNENDGLTSLPVGGLLGIMVISRSIYTSNELRRNRQAQNLFQKYLVR